MRLGNDSTKKNNYVKFKNQSTFFKTNNFKSQKSMAFNELILNKFTKEP